MRSRLSRRRSPSGLAVTLGMLLATTGALASGCGEGDAIVGGQCIPGYVRCGSTCCASTTAGAHPDGGGDDGSGLDDGGVGGQGDGATRPHADGSTDAAPGADASTDASSGDASGDDSSSGGGGPDGSSGDGSSTSGDAATPDAAGSDDGGSGGGVDAGIDEPLVCVPPLVACGGRCIDVTGDPLNCGGCGIVCPSEICQNSQCVGSTAGGFVYVGHDFAIDPASSGPASVLSNAAFMPRNNPLHVMSYERFAQPVAIASVDAVLLGTAALVGRQVSLTATSVDADIPAKLSPQSFDVLVVHDQARAASGTLAALGASWATTLTTFTQHHGIVVVLDGGSGVGEMPAFSTATGLLQVSSHTVVGSGTALEVLAPGDAVGIGVVSPYAASASSVFLTSEPNAGNVVYVVGGMGSNLSPVVIHKVF